MGAKATRIARFIETDPICYFCATRCTESEDHVPSRECFFDRIGPEGFVFPACKLCNNGAGQLEQVVALYLLIANKSDRLSLKQMQRLANGVRNNNPELLPMIELRANLARQHFRNKGLQLDKGQTFAEQPIATLPVGHQKAFQLFARRLTCALFYKETGRPLPLDFYIIVAWLPWYEGAATDAVENAINLFPAFTMTNRRNTDIGDQFSYRWGMHSDGSIFGFVAKFSESYYVFGAAASPELHQGHGNMSEGWVQHSEDVTGITRPVGAHAPDECQRAPVGN
jgi:hypothetical protein